MYKTTSDQYHNQILEHTEALRRILYEIEQVRIEDEEDCRVGSGIHTNCDCYHTHLVEHKLGVALDSLNSTMLTLRRQDWSF